MPLGTYTVESPPAEFETKAGRPDVLLVGCAALLLAPILNALREPIASIYSGYPVMDIIGLGTASIELKRRRHGLLAAWSRKRLQDQFDEFQNRPDLHDSRLGSDRDAILRRGSERPAGRRTATSKRAGASRGTALGRTSSR